MTEISIKEWENFIIFKTWWIFRLKAQKFSKAFFIVTVTSEEFTKSFYNQSFSLTECIGIVGVRKYLDCLSVCVCVCASVCVCVCVCVCVWKLSCSNGWVDFDEIFYK